MTLSDVLSQIQLRDESSMAAARRGRTDDGIAAGALLSPILEPHAVRASALAFLHHRRGLAPSPIALRPPKDAVCDRASTRR